MQTMKFKMSYSRVLPYILAVCTAVLLLLSVILLVEGVWLVGIGNLLIAVGVGMFGYGRLLNPPVYIIDDNTITLKNAVGRTEYPIDRIVRIQYFDLETEYSRGFNNSRLQLGIYFDRSLFKSVEPIAFCPDNRDGFVEALLSRNPSIQVNREDKQPK